jgi:hypothetical protein
LVRSTQCATFSKEFKRPVSVWVDGRRMGRISRLRVDIIADAAVVYR